jgi:hypothetical protein
MGNVAIGFYLMFCLNRSKMRLQALSTTQSLSRKRGKMLKVGSPEKYNNRKKNNAMIPTNVPQNQFN